MADDYCDECGRPGASFVAAHPDPALRRHEVIRLCAMHAPLVDVQKRRRVSDGKRD